MSIDQIIRFFKAYNYPITTYKDVKGNIIAGNRQFGISYDYDDNVMFFDGVEITGREIIFHQEITNKNLYEMIILGFELTKDIIEEMNNN